MKRVTLSALVVLALIAVDTTISTSYANTKVTIFKVSKVASDGKLQLRAWPSVKSRIKKSLPYNAKDLTETGKKRIIGKTKWLEVNWKNTRGWVNGHYLKKTGVLLHAKSKLVASRTSRNNSSKKTSSKQVVIQAIEPATTSNEMPAASFGGDRYDHQELAATEIKAAYSSNKRLNCSGSTPAPWHIKMNMGDKKMVVSLPNNKAFSVPIKYHEWASPTKIRMNMGGNRGRNIVDVNLEKTDACNDGLSKVNFMYKINATINRKFYSGCCAVISQ